MDVRQLYPAQWITHDDLGERRFRLTISAVGLEAVHDPHTHTKVEKLIVAFEGRKKTPGAQPNPDAGTRTVVR